MEKKRKIMLVVLGVIVFSVITVVLILINKSNNDKKKNTKNDIIPQCEKMISDHILAINNRKISTYDYDLGCNMDSLDEFMEAYIEITKSDEVYFKNKQEQKYMGDMEFIAKSVGEDFEITYTIKNKEELDEKRIKYIEEGLKTEGINAKLYFQFLVNELEKSLEYFNADEEKLDANNELLLKCIDDLVELDITRAYKFDVEFCIKDDKEMKFDMEIYFAEANEEVFMLRYIPEEPEEDPEYFGVQAGINPTLIADEVIRYSDYDWTVRGESNYFFGESILENDEGWIQTDGSGNKIYFTHDENGTEILEYVDANGNAITGFEGVNYRTGNDTEDFIYIYSSYDESTYEYSELKNTIIFIFCNEERVLLEIDGKEVEFKGCR